MLKKDALTTDPQEITMRGLGEILQVISGGDYLPREDKIERLYNSIKEDSFDGATLHGVQMAMGADGHILFWREAAKAEVQSLTQNMIWEHTQKIMWVEEENYGDSTLKVGPLGRDGWSELVKLFEGAKDISIPMPIRLSLLVIRDFEGGLVGVPAVGYFSTNELPNGFKVVPKYPEWAF